MAKRKNRPKRTVRMIQKSWIDQANEQLKGQDYEGLAQTCQAVLRDASPKSQKRADALEYLAGAYTMLKQFENAYQTLSQLLEIDPHPAYFWYNRGMTGRYTMRLVQATYDLEKAVSLEKEPAQRQKFIELLAQTREMAESERAMRGPDFTLEQLQEQQNHFARATQLMNQEKWSDAEQAFGRVIEMGEVLPQSSGNLGLALLMQKKYDQAEAAFKQALKIDPDYDLAKQNLAMLPIIRQSGETPHIAIRNPFADTDVGLTLQE